MTEDKPEFQVPEDPIDRALLFLQLHSMGKLPLTEDEKRALGKRISDAVFKPNWLLEYLLKSEDGK